MALLYVYIYIYIYNEAICFQTDKTSLYSVNVHFTEYLYTEKAEKYVH